MKGYVYRLVGGLFLLGMLVACTKEINGNQEEPGGGELPVIDEELEAVTIRIGAAETAETRAMHGDENAVEGEFIHTLHFFIVDESNTIEKHIVVTPESTDLDETQQEQAAIGNLPQYTTTVDLLPGKKTMYAFANMENAETTDNQQNMEEYLSELNEGEIWTDIQSFKIQNPAVTVDIEKGQYIPMSVRQEVDLTTDGQRVSLSLVRMVAKVRATLTNRQGASVTVSGLKMSGFSLSAPLFRQETANNPAGEEAWTYEDESLNFTLENDNSYTIPEFYVNETTEGEYVLTLTIGGVDYEGRLKTKDILRNYVLPVALNLSDVNLELTITAYVAPIGGYPVEVKLTDPTLTDNYAINLPEGCTFSIKGLFQTQAGVENGVTEWTWSVQNASTSLIGLDNDKAAIPLTGHITALQGQTATLEFTVAQPNRVTGTLQITTVPLQDQGKLYSNAVDWLATPRRYEPIHLTTP